MKLSGWRGQSVLPQMNTALGGMVKVRSGRLAPEPMQQNVPLTNRVRDQYRKLWTEIFPFDLWPKREARGP